MRNSRLSIIFLCSFLSFTTSLLSQNLPLELTTRVNKDNSVDISYTKQAWGYYYISLNFTNLNNANNVDNGKAVKGKKGIVMTLNPTNPKRNIQYRYSYSSVRGKPLRKYPTFVYLLPFPEGRNFLVRETVVKNENKNETGDFKVLILSSSQPDSVLCMRKGLVVSVEDNWDADQDPMYMLNPNKNEILVEHEDGTLARYAGFEKNSIVVKEGDLIYPGNYIGKLVKSGEHEFSHNLFFTLYYLDAAKLDAFFVLKTIKMPYTYIDPEFYFPEKPEKLAQGKQYTVHMSKDLIFSEMSKKEIKKYLAKN